MKKMKELNYGRAIAFGIASELALLSAQYLLLIINHLGNVETPISFTTEYMMSSGFYIFLIPGFILFATVVFFIMRNYTIPSVAYLLVFLLVAAVIEVIFYLSITANYQGAFVYSILDKVLGTGLGVIGYFAVGTPEEHSDKRRSRMTVD